MIHSSRSVRVVVEAGLNSQRKRVGRVWLARVVPFA